MDDPEEWCCPACGQPIHYDGIEERYVCDPCGLAFGDWGGRITEDDAERCLKGSENASMAAIRALLSDDRTENDHDRRTG